MQLKSLAKTTEALNKITNILNNTELSRVATKEALVAIGESYTTETLKEAIALSTLDKEQIKVILSANGLQGELLETTADELANAASTNAVAASQVTTTGTTIGLGTVFKYLWIQIKAATASMLKFLLTTPLGWATLAISAFAGAALGIKKYNDSLEEAKQKIRETAEESKSAVKTIKSDFDELSSTTDSIKQRYAQFAQEVENLGKVNQSRGSLSNDEYAEFLDLSNQLAELFPQLTVNYDENGNAILGLSGNVNTIVGSLNDLVSVRQKLANQEIMKNMPDIWAGFMLDDEEFNRNLDSAEKAVENHLKWAEEIKKRSTLTLTNESSNNFLVKTAKEAGIMNSRYGNDFYRENHTASEYAANSFDSAEWDFTKLSDEEFDKLLDKLQEFGAEYEDTVQIVKGNIASANSDMAGYINIWLSDEWNFNRIENPDLQNAVKSMLQSGDWVGFIPETVDANNWDKVSDWLQNEFLYEINKVQDNKEISKALSEIFTNQDLTPKEKADYIRQVQDYFGEGHAITLSLTPELELTEDLEEQYQDAINFAKEKFEGYDPTEFFKEHSINTQEEIDAWLKIAEAAKDAVEAENKYLNQGQEPSPLLSIPDTITHLNTNLKPAFDSLHAAYQNIFTDDGALDRSSIDILSTCDSIKSKLDEMSELGLKVDYSSFENFVKVLNNTETTEKDMQTAFDSLATSITDAALSGAEDFETMKAALEDLGVVNNEMVAFDALIRNTEALKEAGLDLSEATYDDIEAFTDGIISAENYGQAVNLLKIQKILCAENPLDTSGDIMNLYLLANAAGIATDSILQLMRLNADYAKASAEGNTAASLVALGQMEVVKQKIQNQFAHLGDSVDFATIGGGTSAAGNAGRSAGRSYRDALKEELGELDSIISGVTRSIDEQISSVNEQKSTALEALDAEKNALEEAKDAAVEALEAERDARLEVIEAQKEQLEEQASLIDRQIEQKQKEIDAINDAADARQRETDLQKAQYELERMQNQHTILQYSEAEGMHYVQDTSGIRDAREQADEAKRQIEIAGIEKEIDLLENEKDLIQEQIDLLDEQTELINTFYDAEIEKVEKFYDDQIRAIETRRAATESHFESVIRNLGDSKAKYEELTSVVDKAELSAKLKQLGIDEEALLSGSEEEFRKLKDTYMGIVSQLNEGNDAVMTSLQSLSGFTDTASQTTAIASDVGTIADGLNRIPDSQTITNLSGAFDALAESINKVAAALGLSKEAEIGTLAQAILNLNNIPLDDASKGIIAYFTNLKTAIDSVTSAINGGGGESSDNEGQGGSPGKSGEARGKDSKGGGGSLADAITSMGETAAEVIGEADAEGDGTVIGEFGSLKTAVDNVTSSVGTGESEDGNNKGGDKTKAGGKSRNKDEDSGGLTGSIVNLGKTTEETLGEPGGDGIIGRFEQFKEPISEAAGHVQSISDGLDAIDGKEVECTITVNVNQTGGADMGGAVLGKMNLDSTSYSAKFGKSNANGTGKNKGLPKAERNALISEYGQTELTVFPNGNTVLTSEPTLMDLPKGTVIFNEDQTKQLMQSKVHIGDTSHTDHATVNVQPPSSGENRIVPFQPGDLMYDYMQKWNAYFGNTGRQTAMLMPGSMYERSKQLYNTANQITGNNIAGKNQPNVHVGDIHITCPGVTSKEVAKQVGVELNHMFSGLHLDADQQSRMR